MPPPSSEGGEGAPAPRTELTPCVKEDRAEETHRGCIFVQVAFALQRRGKGAPAPRTEINCFGKEDSNERNPSGVRFCSSRLCLAKASRGGFAAVPLSGNRQKMPVHFKTAYILTHFHTLCKILWGIFLIFPGKIAAKPLLRQKRRCKI